MTMLWRSFPRASVNKQFGLYGFAKTEFYYALLVLLLCEYIMIKKPLKNSWKTKYIKDFKY